MEKEAFRKARTILHEIEETNRVLAEVLEKENDTQIQLVDKEGSIVAWMGDELTKRLITKQDVIDLLKADVQKLEDKFKTL